MQQPEQIEMKVFVQSKNEPDTDIPYDKLKLIKTTMDRLMQLTIALKLKQEQENGTKITFVMTNAYFFTQKTAQLDSKSDDSNIKPGDIIDIHYTLNDDVILNKDKKSNSDIDIDSLHKKP